MTERRDERKAPGLTAALVRLQASERELSRRDGKLREAEQRYDHLVEDVQVPYLVTDLNGIIRTANHAAAELLTVDQRFLPGKPLAAFLPPDDRTDFLSALVALAREEHDPGDRALRIRRRSYETANVIASVHVERPAGGLAPSLRWTLRDLMGQPGAVATERELALLTEESVRARTAELVAETRRAEYALALLRGVLGKLPVGVLIVDAPSGRLLLENEELRGLLGSEPTSSPLAAQALQRVLAGETLADEAAALVRPDGTGCRVTVSGVPVLDAYGVIAAGVLYLVDLTLQERRELAEREFVANAAHGLQTPLAAIAAAVEVLQTGGKNDPAALDRFLAHIEAAAARLGRLSRALLTLARIQALDERPSLAPLPLRPLLEELAVQTPGGREIGLQCPDDLAVIADRDLLEEAVANLLQNAAKYGDGSPIQVTASRASGGFARIVVSDGGPGIPGGAHDRLFERFVRGESGGEGFGLGLAVVQQVVGALGGDVGVASLPGRGTTVTLRIRAAEDGEP
jgi:PAS domain S-box-containing protein